MRYRPDIDGLRAVAVTSVVAYHYGARGFSGGFVGVDIFFVISGFLITGLLSSELNEKRFTIVDFYRRRVRRIFPALAIMLAVTALVASVLLLPHDLHDFRSSLLAATASSSNFYFAHHTGYFTPDATTQPLLHTWSLAVEEQFYIFFPLLLMALHRFFERRVKLVLIALTVLSFGDFALIEKNSTNSFYLLPTRAWELGVGALLAIGTIPAARNVRVGNLASALGISAIGFSVYHYSTNNVPRDVAGVLGATLIIYAGPQSWVNRLLSLRPAVFIGLVSYSLYLWHWPILVLYKKYALNPQLSGSTLLCLAAVSLTASVLSWRFIEKPLRRLPLRRGRELALFAGSVLGATALLAAVLPGLASAVNPETTRMKTILAFSHQERHLRGGTCFISDGVSASSFATSHCLDSVPGKRNILLLGDSHAADLWSGLSTASSDINVMQATASGCFPMLPIQGEQRCTTVLRYVLQTYLASHKPDAIVLSARWTSAGKLDAGLHRMVAFLKSHTNEIVIVGPHPEYTAALPELLVRGLKAHDPGLANAHQFAAVFTTDRHLRTVASKLGVGYVSLTDALCPGRICRTYESGDVPMNFDYGHFTKAGSAVAGKILAAQL